jgi:hypothetical protein
MVEQGLSAIAGMDRQALKFQRKLQGISHGKIVINDQDDGLAGTHISCHGTQHREPLLGLVNVSRRAWQEPH